MILHLKTGVKTGLYHPVCVVNLSRRLATVLGCFCSRFEEVGMGLRFRKSIKVAPGIKVNLGKKGASVSLGGNGASLNIGKKGTRTTVGMPGTGLSYSKFKKHDADQQESSGMGMLIVVLVIIGIIIFMNGK